MTVITGAVLGQDLLFTDGLYDIGKSGATRPRDGFFSRNFVVGGTLATSGLHTASGGLKIDGGGFAAGSLGKDAANGLIIAGIAGSTNDFIIYSAGGSPIMRSPVGSVGVVFNGAVSGITSFDSTSTANIGTFFSVRGAIIDAGGTSDGLSAMQLQVNVAAVTGIYRVKADTSAGGKRMLYISA